MYKVLFFLIYFSSLLFSCKGTENDRKEIENNALRIKSAHDRKTMNIELIIPHDIKAYDDEEISKIAHIKVKGAFGDINAKLDATTQASSPSGVVKKINDYRYISKEEAYSNKKSMPDGLRGLLLFGATPYSAYLSDGFTGNEYGQKIINSNISPKITGTGIKKIGSIIIIRYIHAGGTSFTPMAYEIISEQNGIFRVSRSSLNFKKSKTPIDKDINFDDIEFIYDSIESGVPFWEGELRGSFDNNIFTLKGTLVLQE